MIAPASVGGSRPMSGRPMPNGPVGAVPHPVQPPGDLTGRAGPIPDGPGPEAIDPLPRPVLGVSLPHESAAAHVTGTATFLDDIPPARGELFVGVVGGRFAHGRITSIDRSAALRIDGVAAVFTADDIP